VAKLSLKGSKLLAKVCTAHSKKFFLHTKNSHFYYKKIAFLLQKIAFLLQEKQIVILSQVLAHFLGGMLLP